jgi:polysaccharide export outer membrane protein
MAGERAFCIAVSALILATLVGTSTAVAQQETGYVIGPGDALSISVWRHPDLDRTIVVRSTGLVTFPPIGDLMAAGRTPTELARDIMQRLRDYTRETTQVTVSMAQFNSRAVYLTGQVTAPGRYSFERIPDILQLLSQAGGPLPSADLANVSIVRPAVRGPEIIRVDIASYMRGQSTAPLPALQPGDTIEIPPLAAAGGLAGPGLVYVMGEINAPGAYPSTEGLDIVQLLALAGGTTPEARLEEVAVIMDGGGSHVVASVDVQSIIEHGTADPFYLGPGDRVFIPHVGEGVASQILGGAASVLGWGRDILSSYLLYLSIDTERQQREAAEAARDAAEAAREAAEAAAGSTP